MATIGERISVSRKRLGLSQKTLADKVGVHRTTVAFWETGKFRPERHSYLIAEALKVDPDWLITGEAVKPAEVSEKSKSGLIHAMRHLTDAMVLGRKLRGLISKKNTKAFALCDEQTSKVLEALGEIMLLMEHHPNSPTPVFSEFMTNLQRQMSNRKN